MKRKHVYLPSFYLRAIVVVFLGSIITVIICAGAFLNRRGSAFGERSNFASTTPTAPHAAAASNVIESYGRLPLSFEINQSKSFDAQNSSQSQTPTSYAKSRTEALASIKEAYGKLPLTFETNQGQTDTRVSFFSRGPGYGLFLTAKGAVLSLATRRDRVKELSLGDEQDETPLKKPQETLSMRLKGALTRPVITGIDELSAKVNYFSGNASNSWRKNVPTFSRVRYSNVYPGVDLIYYGNQSQLEYDFELKPGASPSRIRLTFDGAKGLALNARGDLLVKTQAGEVTLLKPVAFQQSRGKKVVRPSNFVLGTGNEVRFYVSHRDPKLPLVIDPVLMYSTYLGGSDFDAALGIAVDSSGNAYITGQTFSTDFPLVNPTQPTIGNFSDAFVTKLNPTGTAIVYSTFLGGGGNDIGNSIAIDGLGSAYITGQTNSANFPLVNPLHPTFGGSLDGFVAKLSPSGSELVYSTYLGGTSSDTGNGIAVDQDGIAYVTGQTDSRDFPTSNALQPNKFGNAVFKSANAAGDWTPSDAGITAASVTSLTLDPGNSATIYAAAENGIFRSDNGGVTWTRIGLQQTWPLVNKIVIDPSNVSILYAATSSGIFRSTDSGVHFSQVSNGLSPTFTRSLVIDPSAPTTLYAATVGPFVYKTTNSGASWTSTFISDVSFVTALAIDPGTPATMYAGTGRGVYKSTNGGISWNPANNGINFEPIRTIVVDPTNTSVLYATSNSGVFKSTTGGTTWTNINANLGAFVTVTAIALDPTNPATIYLGGFSFVYKSIDGGVTWNPANSGYVNSSVNALALDPTTPTTLYIATSSGSEVFVTKLHSDGASQFYSTYLGGRRSDIGNGIAQDENGNAYITGSTSSLDFPVSNALQPVKGDSYPGGTDAFVAKINSTGSALIFSTYLGGDGNDAGRGIVVRSGSTYLVGETNSSNFPVANPIRPSPSNSVPDAFVTKLSGSGTSLEFSTCLGGSGTDQGLGIAVGADGMIYVTGSTFSPDFPTLRAPQQTYNGNTDAFITKLDSATASFVYSTYLGGSSADQGNGIAVDGAGSTYVVGTTSSGNFPTARPIQPALRDTDAFVTKIGSSIDLGVVIVDSPDPVQLGHNLTYDVTVSNNGELPATAVVLTSNLPAGSTFVSADAGQSTCIGGSVVTCNLGNLDGGAQSVVRIVIMPPVVRNIRNIANVTSNEVDPLPANNTASEDTLVDFADLSVAGATAFSKVAPGGRINYLFTVANKSGRTADSVTFNDNLPAGTSFVSCGASAGVCGGTGNNRTVTFPSLEVGQSSTVVLVTTVDPAIAEGTILSNTATVSAALPDPISINNSAATTIEVTATPLRQKTNGLVAYSTGRIFTAKADGSEAPAPFPGISSGIFPRWSPDGTKLAFTIGKTQPVYPYDTVYEIEVANADGTGLLTLANNSTDISFNNISGFSWSPDGSRLAYVGKDRSIYIANTDGSGYAKLPNSPSEVKDIDWSSDGSQFVFSKGLGEIFVMNVDGTNLTKLVPLGTGPDGPTHYVYPNWSPDMTKILFVQRSNNYSDIFVMNSDGTGTQRFLNRDSSFAPAWSPDGMKLAYYQGSEVHVIDLDTANDVTLTGNETCCNYGSISWQPIPTNTPLPPPGPPAPRFSLSGHITVDGQGFSFGQIKLTGRITATMTLLRDTYEFVRLPPGEYTVTPISITHSFTPQSRTVTISNADLTSVDFLATFVPANITGHVTDNAGNPLAGITISSSGGYPVGTTVTDNEGFYSFPNVQRGRNYNIYPDPADYTFEPVVQYIPYLTTSQVVNFVGTLRGNIIGGRVVETINGRGLSGIQVNLTQGGVFVTSILTDSDGRFTFGARRSNHQYSVYLVSNGNFIFEPREDPTLPLARIIIPNLTSDQDLTFLGTRVNTVQFSAASQSGGEERGYIEVLATRSGDTSAAATVNYLSADGTALQASDYTVAAGTLRFAPLEIEKRISILLTDDTYQEPPEVFTLTLSSPNGAQLGETKVASINITDNDSTPGAPNPIDDAQFFVRQHYYDFLSRQPDQGGLDYWTAQITGCGSDPVCLNSRRVGVSAAYFIELEFQETGAFVYRFHQASFGQRPGYAQFMPDRSRLVAGSDLESGKQAFANNWVQRPEFLTKYPASLTGAEFIDALLLTVLQSSGVDLSNQRTALNDDFNLNHSRARIIRLVVDDPTFKQAEYNRAFVLMQYFGYLRRDPDEGGYQFWLDVLNNRVPGNFRGMVCAFITSGEYQARFSSVRTRTDSVCGDIGR